MNRSPIDRLGDGLRVRLKGDAVKRIWEIKRERDGRVLLLWLKRDTKRPSGRWWHFALQWVDKDTVEPLA